MPDLSSDQTLLKRFAQREDEDAFAALVSRYSGLVFHTALRSTNSHPLAEEITQTIFATLARKAGKLSQDPRPLVGWLHRATILESARARRGESRHLRKKVALMNEGQKSNSTAGELPALSHLDVALGRLQEAERNLVLWHYAEGISFPDIARRLGKTTAAVQKQGQRTLAKLQKILMSKGVTLTVTSLATLLTSEFAKAAPTQLLGSLTPSALSHIAPASLTTTTILMTTKTKILLPSIALLTCGVPLAYQQHTLVSLRRDNSQIESRLSNFEEENRREMSSVDSKSHQAKSKVSMAKSLLDIDLAEMGKTFHEMHYGGGMVDMRIMVEYQGLIEITPVEDLISIAKQIPQADIPEEWKLALHQQLLLQILPEKSPEEALKLAFQSSMHDLGRDKFYLSRAFLQWGKEEPEAAITWFDKMISEGKFDSKSLARDPAAQLEFEAAAFSSLLADDPDTAKSRLEAIPEKLRAKIFDHGYLLTIPKNLEPTFGKILRETIPAPQFDAALAFHTSELLSRGGFQDVTQFISQIEASPVEQQSIAVRTVTNHFQGKASQKKSLSAADIESVHQFYQVNAPERADKLTGMSLTSYTLRAKDIRSPLTALKSHYAEHKNDKILVSFLSLSKKQGGQDEEISQFLTELFPDPEKRSAITSQLAQ